ncbi:T9SS type A sorting domain-containing protein [bacterium]|nr:T9SS type A sorting domain-containing protein [bacterium]
MKNKVYIFVLAVVLALGLFANLWAERRECRIYIWDNAGAEAYFSDPESPSDSIRPADAIESTLEEISSSASFSVFDSVIIDRGQVLPEVINDYNLIFITLGWPGSGSPGISNEEDSTLFVFLINPLGHATDWRKHGIYVEGNNFAYDYGDTSTRHFTYSGIMWVTGGVLWTDVGFQIYSIYGEPGSIAEGMYFDYPGHLEDGPHTSNDIIGRWRYNPYSPQAQYLFSAGVGKDPSRGMQRRGYAGGGACICASFVFGNLQDMDESNTKADLMYRMVDFMQPPTVALLTELGRDSLALGATYALHYEAYDNCGITRTRYEFAIDGCSTWIFIGETDRNDSLFFWTTPATPIDKCQLRLTVWDSSGNVTADSSEFFSVRYFSGIDYQTRLPRNFHQLYCHPNPFNSQTNISFKLDLPGMTTIEAYDFQGRKRATILKKSLEKGLYQVAWDSSDPDMNSGIYFIRVSQHGNSSAQKLVLLK